LPEVGDGEHGLEPDWSPGLVAFAGHLPFAGTIVERFCPRTGSDLDGCGIFEKSDACASVFLGIHFSISFQGPAVGRPAFLTQWAFFKARALRRFSLAAARAYPALAIPLTLAVPQDFAAL